MTKISLPHTYCQLGTLVLLFALTSCEKAGYLYKDPAPQYTYTGEIGSLLKARCLPCHEKNAGQSTYELDSWRGLLGPGGDHQRNAVPGNPQSQFLSVLGSASHPTVLSGNEYAILESWIVNDQMAYFESSFHPRDWLYPAERNADTFHGGYLRNRKWDLGPCKGCHGDDLSGGLAKKSCLDCHAQGPLGGCTTCHGGADASGLPYPDLSWKTDPRHDAGVGAHLAHANPRYFEAIACKECHLIPTQLNSEGHLFDRAETLTSDFRAEVVFSDLAKAWGTQASYQQDSLAGSCTVYCHGISLKNPGSGSIPHWLSEDSIGCGSCHPVPMVNNGGADCTVCHQQSVSLCTAGTEDCYTVTDGVAVRFASKSQHMDGQTPIGNKGDEGTCYACHGTAQTQAAPAPDLHGKSDISSVTVGLHKIHVGNSSLRRGIPCSDCHNMPSTYDSPGHIDSDLPAEVVFSDLANGKLRDPDTTLVATWDRETGTCTNVYCHSRPQSTVGAVWKWTETLSGGLVCNSCHKGKKDYPLNYCQTCHFNFYIDGELDPNKHLNGQLDF